VVLSRRLAEPFSVSLAPFVRVFRFDSSIQSGTDPVRTGGGWVISGGASLSAELKLAAFVVAPAIGVEVVENPQGAGLFVVPSPGLDVGFRW